MAIELRQFRYFLAVAEEGHVTRAAERLGIQQPPLSQQIKALEKSLSVRLFDRLPRGVVLTPAGRTFLAEARRVLADADQAVTAARRAAQGETGRLAIGMTSSSSLHPFVPRVLRRFRERAPGVEVALEEAGTVELVDALRHERIDIAFARSPVSPALGLKSRLLLEEEMVAALPAGHRLVKSAKPIMLAALAEEPFLLYRRAAGPGLYDAIVTACGNAGFSPRIVQEAPRMLSTLSLVAAGLGVSLVPASMQCLKAEGVIYRSLARASGLRAPIIMLTRERIARGALSRFVETSLGQKREEGKRPRG